MLAPDQLNQNLRFSKISRPRKCTFKCTLSLRSSELRHVHHLSLIQLLSGSALESRSTQRCKNEQHSMLWVLGLIPAQKLVLF